MKYGVVTGSTRGIGYSIAKKLIENGYHVFINGRTKRKVEFPDGRYTFVEADMSTEDGVTKLFDSIIQKTNKIDCLVLNAGATCRKSILELSYTDWKEVMDTNVIIPALLVRKLLPNITEKGNILFVGSMLAEKPHARSLPYGVSKAGVHSLVQGLVKEVNSYGIKVNGIAPGFIGTEWQNEKPEWLRAKIESKIAMKRFGEPEEVASLCYEIITNGYINGAIMNIDGGYDME